MIAREWKARVPNRHKEGFKGAQIFCRRFDEQHVEITLITYWPDRESVMAFAGQDIDVAKLYPEDDQYELDPDTFVHHYDVLEHQFVS
ncbi:antibiotic biosynthesis monooxygenase [Marinomonas mediterranea]|uniref:Antibiotic biosynthesis monooxygenase n=1 Tax=Marinomonas mediterranea (strain ATCC 700492 / JCM 21426 / NBRC 103028 / MMB-1) TaxID=717774 RepID=F2JWW2_MARM1|nr:hypothetical protein [Marinomonas mediterranea]ADZ92979.1 hypothetical protein Marme_3769 [Marinomonas mediterranea MMB-1]WCN14954.1 antibiotic biosynthesis monooxygenase [Marinomonas mediterranea]WCN18998.1 antibiotic biosynthesis monooxygenase [Marinomonas mediterranea MMB-1]